VYNLPMLINSSLFFFKFIKLTLDKMGSNPVESAAAELIIALM